MTARLILMLAIVLLTVSCRQVDSATAVTDDTMHCEASFQLGAGAELRLLSDGNLSQLELYYGGDLQELVGTANTDYVRSDNGQITLDTLTDTLLTPAYVVRTYDRSSTYGAEVWYVLYPYRRDDPDGPWNIVKVPTDQPSMEDVAWYIDWY